MRDGWAYIASRDYLIRPIDLMFQHRSAGHQYEHALPTGKSFSIGESQGTGLLRRLSGAGTVGDGGVDLSTELHLLEIRALVPVVSKRCPREEIRIDHSGGAGLHNDFSK